MRRIFRVPFEAGPVFMIQVFRGSTSVFQKIKDGYGEKSVLCLFNDTGPFFWEKGETYRIHRDGGHVSKDEKAYLLSKAEAIIYKLDV